MAIKVVQRISEPSFVIKLWKTIKELRDKNLAVSKQQLINHMTLKFRCLPGETIDQISKAIYDGLLLVDENKKYLMIPLDIPPSEVPDKDMFCYTCHTAGEVVPCKTCWRVMHGKVGCWEGDYSTRVCKECQLSSDESEKQIRGRIPTEEEMRQMLLEVVKAIKVKCPEIGEMFNISSQEDRRMWRNVLFLPEMTFQVIEDKVNKKRYKRFLEFYQDFRLLLHNILLIFETRSLLGSKVVTAHKTVMTQENSIRLCIDCYINWSKRLETPDWFSIPCNQPHPVKLIKMANGSLIPGKVMLEEEDFCQAKLFGLDNGMQIFESRQIGPISQMSTPKNAEETAAFRQFHKYLENLEARGMPLPQLRLSFSNCKPNRNSTKDGNKKRGPPDHQSDKKTPKFLMLKTGVKAYAKLETNSNGSDNEEEQKFSRQCVKDNLEWVRRSSRRRQPVKRYVDEIISEDKEMKKVKNEIVGEHDSDESVQERSPADIRLKIEKTNEGWISRSRQSEQLVSHEVMEEAGEPASGDVPSSVKYIEGGRIDDLKQQLAHKDNEMEVMRQNHELELAHKDNEMEVMRRNHELELAEAKRRQFCTVCLRRAVMYCCFDHSYCCKECQNRDWNQNKHSKDCNNEAFKKRQELARKDRQDRTL